MFVEDRLYTDGCLKLNLIIVMRSHMIIEVELGEEALVAKLTLVVLYAIMDYFVFVEVRLLSKRYDTSWHIAYVWSLFRVSPQVVEEVVPAAEDCRATVELTA